MEPKPPKVKKKKDMPADLFSQLYFQFVTPKEFSGAGAESVYFFRVTFPLLPTTHLI